MMTRTLPSRDEASALVTELPDTIFCRRVLTPMDVEGEKFEVEIYNYKGLGTFEPTTFAKTNGWELRGLTFVRKMNTGGEDVLQNKPSPTDSATSCTHDSCTPWHRYILLDKFFNYGEGKGWTAEAFRDVPVTRIQDKVDGSIINFVPFHLGDQHDQHDVKILAKSKSMFESPHAKLAQDILEGSPQLQNFLRDCLLKRQLMPIFELVGATNTVVVRYLEHLALALLHIRHMESGEYLSREEVQQLYLQHFDTSSISTTPGTSGAQDEDPPGEQVLVDGRHGDEQDVFLPSHVMQQIERGAVVLSIADTFGNPKVPNPEKLLNRVYNELAKRHKCFVAVEYTPGTTTRRTSTSKTVNLISSAEQDKEFISVNSLVQMAQKVEHGDLMEGFVLSFANGKMAKLKTGSYSSFHKVSTSWINSADGAENVIMDFIVKGTLDDLIAYFAHQELALRHEIERVRGGEREGGDEAAGPNKNKQVASSMQSVHIRDSAEEDNTSANEINQSGTQQELSSVSQLISRPNKSLKSIEKQVEVYEERLNKISTLLERFHTSSRDVVSWVANGARAMERVCIDFLNIAATTKDHKTLKKEFFGQYMNKTLKAKIRCKSAMILIARAVTELDKDLQLSERLDTISEKELAILRQDIDKLRCGEDMDATLVRRGETLLKDHLQNAIVPGLKKSKDFLQTLAKNREFVNSVDEWHRSLE